MDLSSPALGELALAEACRQSGDFAAGLAAAERAYAHAAEPAERARAGWLRAFFIYRRSDFAGLLALVDTLSPLLRDHAGPDLPEYLRSVTLAASEMARFDIALPYAYEVNALAEADGRPAPRALALNAFGACFERMGDPWQAERLMREALRLVRDGGTPRDVFITLNNLCAVLIGAYYLLRGESTAPEAQAALARALPLAREAIALVPAVGEPFVRVFARGNLGEILVHLGEADEARELLDAARAEAVALGFRPQEQRVRCSLAEWELRHGDPALARDDMLALLADGAASPTTAVRAHHALYAAAQRLGDAALALRHLEHKAELERRRAVLQLRAQSEQFITRLEAEQSRREAEHQRERARVMEADALRDQLTGLSNRRDVAQRLPALLAEAARTGHPVAVVMLDLDHFKQVNDRFGHLVGDQVLAAVAQILRENLRATDLIARTGGEEFLAVLPDAPPGRAREACERMRARVEAHPWAVLAPGLAVTTSAGLATAPPYDEAVLMARADAALYRAKAAGRNRVVAD
jgi:diguanylate cyclase (GGDEF)-like protein